MKGKKRSFAEKIKKEGWMRIDCHPLAVCFGSTIVTVLLLELLETAFKERYWLNIAAQLLLIDDMLIIYLLNCFCLFSLILHYMLAFSKNFLLNPSDSSTMAVTRPYVKFSLLPLCWCFIRFYSFAVFPMVFMPKYPDFILPL